MFGDGGSSTSTNPTHTYALPANYMALLTVTPQLCPQLKDTAMKLIRVEAPVAGISYNPINTVINVPITLSARNIGISYSWSPTTGLTNPGTSTPTLIPTRQQLYLVRIINSAGCTTIDSQLVRIFENYNIYLPDAFTPNGDGNNDLLYPFIVGIQELRYLKVFNRWGNLVFETKSANPAAGWNGIYKGKAQPSETYVWIAEGIDLDGKVVKRGGNVILVR
jgi:gliding motility-associated-like protein